MYIKQQDKFGKSLAHYICIYGDNSEDAKQFFELLVKLKFDFNVLDNELKKPINYAVMNKNVYMVIK